MKTNNTGILLMILSAAFSLQVNADNLAADMSELSTKDKANVNYSIGYRVGTDLKKQKIEVREDKLIEGIEDALAGKPKLTYAQRRHALVALQQRAVEAQKDELNKQIEINGKKGKEFLEKNAKKDGVITLSDGLQYKVIKSGSGITPGANSLVTVNYRGRLIDGKEFDSSYRYKKPARFKVNRVIPGWTEALQKMHEGDKWELYIPADLAYGKRGMGLRIPPNSTLIFELELLSVR